MVGNFTQINGIIIPFMDVSIKQTINSYFFLKKHTFGWLYCYLKNLTIFIQNSVRQETSSWDNLNLFL